MIETPQSGQRLASAIAVRLMQPSDAAMVAGLCGELGYPTATENIALRFASIARHGDAAVYVADAGGGQIVGWIHVFGTRVLEAEPYVEIGGLIVGHASRGQGVGTLLVAVAERWAVEHGYSAVRVRSRIAREDAHRFYERRGYLRIKTQHNFQKDLKR